MRRSAPAPLANLAFGATFQSLAHERRRGAPATGLRVHLRWLRMCRSLCLTHIARESADAFDVDAELHVAPGSCSRAHRSWGEALADASDALCSAMAELTPNTSQRNGLAPAAIQDGLADLNRLRSKIEEAIVAVAELTANGEPTPSHLSVVRRPGLVPALSGAWRLVADGSGRLKTTFARFITRLFRMVADPDPLAAIICGTVDQAIPDPDELPTYCKTCGQLVLRLKRHA